MKLGLSLASENGGLFEQGSQTPGGSVDVLIVHRSALGVAPEGFIFEVSVSGFDATGPGAGDIYDDRFHELYYHWDFGDNYTFLAPQNTLPAHRNANIAYGPTASHTYRSPGTYLVSVSVVEPSSGKAATGTLSVTVGNPDRLFSGAATFFVDIGGDFAGKPTGAAEYTNLSSALSDMVAAGPANPRRIMLRRGQTFDLIGQTWPIGSPSFQVIASNGTGADPVIDWTPDGPNSMFFLQNIDNRADSDPAKSIVFQNIDMRGDADVTVGTGTVATFFFNFGPYPPRDFLLDGCTLRNVALAIFDRGTNRGANIQGGECYKVINDCVFSDWIASGMFEISNRVTALVGTRFSQNTGAIADYDGVDHSIIAPYRGSMMDTLIVDACDFFCNTGWSATPNPNYIAVQPGIRFNSAASEGAKLNLQRSSIEAGFEVVSLGDANGEDAVAINAVIEKNILLSNFQGWWFFDVTYSGLTVRNNILVHPGVGDASGRDPQYVMRLSRQGTDPKALNAPIKVYNNTLVNLLAGSSYVNSEVAMTWGSDLSQFANITIANNIDHQPNLTIPIDAGPLDMTSVLFVPRYDGYLSTFISPKNTNLATPANTVVTYAPLTGSPALGAALSDPVALDDFYGNLRPQYPSRGAFEMPS